MISVLDYTRKLLYEHDCVVLPDLGGFLAYFSHAFYSEKNTLYHAPQKRVAFNEALKLDDGLLSHYLTINEQITREDAQARVRQFVEEIKNTIKETGRYSLEGIGTLETNDEGKLQFEPSLDTNFYAEGFGLKSLQVSTIQPNIEIESSESATDWTNSDRAAEELPLEIPRRRRSRIAMYVGGVLLIGTALVGGLSQIPSDSLKSSLNPFELVTTVKGWIAPDKKSNDVKKEALVVLPKVSIAPQSEEVKPDAPVVEPLVEAKPAAPKVIESKPELKKTTVEESTKESLPVSLKSDEEASYLVIAGGFSKLENARKLESKLQASGFESALILNPEPVEGKLIIVAAIGCDNAEKAKAHVGKVSRLAGANAYVMHK